MVLQTAKNEMKKAIKRTQFALRKNLNMTSNYKSVAYSECKSKLSVSDCLKFDNWLDEYEE